MDTKNYYTIRELNTTLYFLGEHLDVYLRSDSSHYFFVPLLRTSGWCYHIELFLEVGEVIADCFSSNMVNIQSRLTCILPTEILRLNLDTEKHRFYLHVDSVNSNIYYRRSTLPIKLFWIRIMLAAQSQSSSSVFDEIT